MGLLKQIFIYSIVVGSLPSILIVGDAYGCVGRPNPHQITFAQGDNPHHLIVTLQPQQGDPYQLLDDDGYASLHLAVVQLTQPAGDLAATPVNLTQHKKLVDFINWRSDTLKNLLPTYAPSQFEKMMEALASFRNVVNQPSATKGQIREAWGRFNQEVSAINLVFQFKTRRIGSLGWGPLRSLSQLGAPDYLLARSGSCGSTIGSLEPRVPVNNGNATPPGATPASPPQSEPGTVRRSVI